ncbi:MAG TPA: hypothetical protein VM509_13220 [Planctomycetota bacterium]|nr:hypothetical protein [Planctomycetota bacterium]
MRPLKILTLPALVTRAAPFAILAAALPVARAQTPPQIKFSVDWKAPTVGQVSTGSLVRITEGDVLTPGSGAPQIGAQPPPVISLSGQQLGLSQYGACVGHPGGTPCGIEVDALSEGTDEKFRPSPSAPGRLWFSVDEFAVGAGGSTPFPSVRTEALLGEACADLFTDAGLPPGPLDIPPAPRANVGAIDGNGLPSATGSLYPGVGLTEPTPPGPGPVNAGDDIDALDIDGSPGFPAGGMYFSLDAGFFDAKSGVPNSNSAAINGALFRGGDVLRTAAPGATPTRYATATQLGLDFFGPGTDDLDALILVENGDGVFNPSTADYDWLPAGTNKDMLMFSVRRGSSVIGKPDSIFGRPICPGDILVPPRAGSQFPGIWIAAENLGLQTLRQSAPEDGDDLDALDLTKRPISDCNHNGIEDSVDIAVGSSMDANNNGIPDECENDKMHFCFCLADGSPCGNGFGYPGSDSGCRNSTGVGTKLAALGSTSVTTDDLTLSMTQMPLNKPAILIMAPNVGTAAILGDGQLCLRSPIFRYFPLNSGSAGSILYGPGLVGYSTSHFGPLGQITSGSTFGFQCWYRDPFGPCSTGMNLSNAARINFLP